MDLSGVAAASAMAVGRDGASRIHARRICLRGSMKMRKLIQGDPVHHRRSGRPGRRRRRWRGPVRRPGGEVGGRIGRHQDAQRARARSARPTPRSCGGSVGLQNSPSRIPQGYQGPALLTLKTVDVKADTGSLLSNEIVIKDMKLDKHGGLRRAKGPPEQPLRGHQAPARAARAHRQTPDHRQPHDLRTSPCTSACPRSRASRPRRWTSSSPRSR